MNIITRHHRDGRTTVSLQQTVITVKGRGTARRIRLHESRTFPAQTAADDIRDYTETLRRIARQMRPTPKANAAAPKQTRNILPR